MSDLAIKLASDLANCAVHAKRLDLMASYFCEVFCEVRRLERERCIAAMVASQPEGMRAVMEKRYREIMEAGKWTGDEFKTAFGGLTETIIRASVEAASEQMQLVVAGVASSIVAVLVKHGIGTEQEYMDVVDRTLAAAMKDFLQDAARTTPAAKERQEPR